MAVRKIQGQLLFVHFLEAKFCVYTVVYSLVCLEIGEIIPAMGVQLLVLLPILQNKDFENLLFTPSESF